MEKLRPTSFHPWRPGPTIVFAVVSLILGLVPALLLGAVILFPISMVAAVALLLAAPFLVGVRLVRGHARIHQRLPGIAGISQRRYLGAGGKWLCGESPELVYCALCGGRARADEVRDCSFCGRNFCAACYREHLEKPEYWHFPYLTRRGSHIAKGHAPCHNLGQSRSGK